MSSVPETRESEGACACCNGRPAPHWREGGWYCDDHTRCDLCDSFYCADPFFCDGAGQSYDAGEGRGR